MACVYIPVQNSEEEVRVALDQLPRDASDILDILKAEQAPLDLWLIIAREYFKQGKVEQFRQILEEGSSPEIDDYYADVKYERIAILNALGAYYSYIGKTETKQREKEDYFIMATQYYNKASRIDMHEPSTWVGKGQLLMAKGELEQAFSAFKIVLDGDRDNVPALIGQACVEFSRGRHSDSLELYKRALQVNPECPGAVRLGIGFCRYKMGQFSKAKQAFLRVLQLDPDNVEAHVAFAILNLQTNEAVGIRTGMEEMRTAFEIYPYCAVALNHLANHFFFTGQHFLVEQLTEAALCAANHGLVRSHAYYNLARSYHSKGDYEKARFYYNHSVKEIKKPREFIFPYYGLGQVQLKFTEYKGALANFEKVLEIYPDSCETLKMLGHIYIKLGQFEKALEFMRKATKVDSRDAEAFLNFGELLISSDTGAALDSLKTARNLLRKGGQEVPVEVLNNIGALHFERGEFDLAEQNFKEALGDGIWLSLIDGKANSFSNDASLSALLYKDTQLFCHLEEDGHTIELPSNKVTILFNLARVFEEIHITVSASILYRLILFKYPDYVDAYLRLAAIAKDRDNLQLSIELVNDALKVNDKCPNALSMLGDLQLKNDDWVKAKETLRAANEAAGPKDSYTTLSLGNWNYYAAQRNEKRNPKLEATHLEKAKELYMKVLKERNANIYAANGAALIFAEKGHFDVAKDLFAQVQEAASGDSFMQMADVWVNLAHVYFAQGNFALAIKMYQNCLRKFYDNTDSQILLYLSRTQYEAEQWQDCKKSLLRAIHLAPSNYALRFNAGVAMQKFSASTLQKAKRTADEVRATVAELQNAVRMFSQLSQASNLHYHGFDEKKIDTHVQYCTHLLEVAKVHREAAEREEQQIREKQEIDRQLKMAEELRRQAEEQRKIQLERRRQEDEENRLKQQEEHFRRVKEQWKGSASNSKRRHENDDDEGGHSERKRRKGGKRRRKDKHSRSQYEMEAEDAQNDYHDNLEEGEAMDYREPSHQYDDAEDNAQELLAATGLEDSDAEDMAAPSTRIRRNRALSESEDDEPPVGQPQPSPSRENYAEVQEGDEEVGQEGDMRDGDAALTDED